MPGEGRASTRSDHRERGQATYEYVGLIVLIAGLVVALVSLTLPARASEAFERAICRITEENCPETRVLATGSPMPRRPLAHGKRHPPDPGQNRPGGRGHPGAPPTDAPRHPPTPDDGPSDDGQPTPVGVPTPPDEPTPVRPVDPGDSSPQTGGNKQSCKGNQNPAPGQFPKACVPDPDLGDGAVPDEVERILRDAWVPGVDWLLGHLDFIPFIDEALAYYPHFLLNVSTWFPNTNSPQSDAVALSVLHALKQRQKNVHVVHCANSEKDVPVLCVQNAEQVIPPNAQAFTMGHVIFCKDDCKVKSDEACDKGNCEQPPGTCLGPFKKDCKGTLLAHELVHVEQYETLGDAFVPIYYGVLLPTSGPGCLNALEREAYQVNGNCEGIPLPFL